MTNLSGCYGKIPSRGDFLRLGGDGGPAEVLDRWFLSGHMDQERHHDLVAAFDRSSPSFVILPHRGHWWAAALFPSRDQVGRRSPFALLAGLRSVDPAEEIGLLPLAFAGFFQKAYAAHLAGLPSDPEALRRLAADAAAHASLDAAESQLLSALDATSQETLWQSLLGDPRHPDRARTLAGVMTVASGALSGAGGVPAAGLRISPVEHQVHCAFWLMLLWLLRNRGDAPALVVLRPGGGKRKPETVALWGQPAGEVCFAALWPGCAPAAFHAPIIDLVQAGSAALTIDPVTRLVDETGLSLRDVLHRLVSQRRTNRYQRPR